MSFANIEAIDTGRHGGQDAHFRQFRVRHPRAPYVLIAR